MTLFMLARDKVVFFLQLTSPSDPVERNPSSVYRHVLHF